MISPNQFKNGMTIVLEGDLYTVTWFQPVKPAKGGGFVRTKLKNLKTGAVLERNFKSEENIEEAFLEDKLLQYQYNSGDLYHFMDLETYEDWVLQKNILGENVKYLKENMELTGELYNGKIIDIRLPVFVELKITGTEPGIKGDTARQALKPAVLETGATIQVPLFINEGDTIKIDTRTFEYAGRV
jgi:elongation factor P